MQEKITTCLCFNDNAKEAVDFYVSVVPNSRVVGTTYYGEGGPFPAGTVMTIDFELGGRRYMAMNGGPHFQFSMAASLMISCDTQEELDDMWERLSEGGATVQCGWLTDRFGLSWQVVPSILSELMSGDKDQCNRVMAALWGMEKLDIAALQEAAQAG